MQVLCNVSREQFTDIDRAGRRYTMELVHYTNAATGERVVTKGYIVPRPNAHVSAKSPSGLVPRQRERGQTAVRARVSRATRNFIRQFF